MLSSKPQDQAKLYYIAESTQRLARLIWHTSSHLHLNLLQTDNLWKLTAYGASICFRQGACKDCEVEHSIQLHSWGPCKSLFVGKFKRDTAYRSTTKTPRKVYWHSLVQWI